MIIISPIIRTCLRIISYILYILTIIAAFGGCINPEIFPLPSLGVLVLPYLVIVTALTAAAWLCFGKFITGGLGAATLIVSWSAISMVFPFSFKKTQEPGTETLKVMTFNCLHMHDVREPDSLNRSLRFMLESDADVICLQELLLLFNKRETPWLKDELVDSLLKKYPYHPTAGGSDQLLLSRYPVVELPALNQEYNSNWDATYRFYRLNVNGTKLTLANVHLPSYHLSDEERHVVTEIRGIRTARKSAGEMKRTIIGKLKKAFRIRAVAVDSLMDAISRAGDYPMIVCGDFNDVPASWSYRKFIEDGFKDAYTQTSFWPTHTYNLYLFRFHLDQIFYRGDLKPLSVKRFSMDASDHYPLMADFQLPKQKP